ncbi:MAG: hypothetical protein HFG95_07085 [Dorea sp.]|nr:hypothetical protein [Dorea sp.]
MPDTSKLKLAEANRQMIKRDKKIMMKLAELLLQEGLVSPEEKFCLTQFIRRNEDV